jgi:hypothetical protein
MLASELIAALQELIDRDGDLEVLVYDPAADDLESATHADTYVGAGGNYIALDAEEARS